MRYIKPITINDDRLVDSNVSESETEWDSVTAWPEGAEVRVGHIVYKASESNTNKNPATDSNRAIWPIFGVTNRMKMFDMTRGADIQTENEDSIVVEIEPGQLYSSIGLFGLKARDIKIEIIDGSAGVVFDEEYSLQSTAGINYFFAWFNAPIVRKEQFVKLNLPYYPGAIVRITISGLGTVKCGKLVIGWGRELGCTKWGLQPSYQDFSDMRYDTFGNLKLVERRKARQRDFIVQVPSEKLAFVESQLIGLGGSPTVFVGSENHEISIILGVVSSFTSTYEYNKSNYNLKILGL